MLLLYTLYLQNYPHNTKYSLKVIIKWFCFLW